MVILIALLLLFPALSMAGSVETQFGSGSIRIVPGNGSIFTFPPSSAGGGASYNLGDDTINPNSTEINANEMVYTANHYTSVAAGTVGNARVYADGVAGTTSGKIAIFSNASPHASICVSDSFSITEGVPGWYGDDMSDDGCGTLSATTAYMLGVITNGGTRIYWNDGAGTWEMGVNSGGTFASPPASVTNFATGDGDLNQDDPFSIYVAVNP